MKKKIAYGQLILNIVYIILSILIVLPFILLVSVSLSSEESIIQSGYRLIPEIFSLDAYRYIFKNPTSIINAYKITFIYSVIAMIVSVLFDAMMAYPLTHKQFSHRKFWSFFLFFTMLFGGGLTPTYILLTKGLHLDDTLWIYILPSMISPWYVFMMRTSFKALPEEIFEAVRIDGGNEHLIFFRFVLPLSKPILATIAFYTFMGKWSDWFTSLMYINDEKLISLQYLLQRLLNNISLLQQLNETSASSLMGDVKIPSESVRMAMAIIVAGPALVIFPAFQKYFVKGVTIGSIKG